VIAEQGRSRLQLSGIDPWAKRHVELTIHPGFAIAVGKPPSMAHLIPASARLLIAHSAGYSRYGVSSANIRQASRSRPMERTIRSADVTAGAGT